jgi:hypothetical protein
MAKIINRPLRSEADYDAALEDIEGFFEKDRGRERQKPTVSIFLRRSSRTMSASAGRLNRHQHANSDRKRNIEPSKARENAYVAAGFFFAFGLAILGCATGSAPRSIDVRRPAVKV